MSMKLKKSLVLIAVIVLITALSSCSVGKLQNGTERNSSVELSENEYESLMEQVANNDVDTLYTDYLRDEAFANAEVFGVDRDGDQGTAYVYLNEGDYVVLKGKAYNMSGSAGEVILKYNYTDEDVVLSEVVWGEQGELKEGWIKENFPAEYFNKVKEYDPYNADGNSVLDVKLREKVEEALGVPVESDSFLEIDTDKGTYEIWEVTNDYGATFDTQTIEKGTLKDL